MGSFATLARNRDRAIVSDADPVAVSPQRSEAETDARAERCARDVAHADHADGRSSSTTGRWWMSCSLMRYAAVSSGVLAEIAIGSAVIHWRARASLE